MTDPKQTVEVHHVEGSPPSESSIGETGLGPIELLAETVKVGVAQGVHSALERIPGTAEHAVKKAAEEEIPVDAPGPNSHTADDLAYGGAEVRRKEGDLPPETTQCVSGQVVDLHTVEDLEYGREHGQEHVVRSGSGMTNEEVKKMAHTADDVAFTGHALE